MKFLTATYTPKLTYTRVSRRAIIDDIANIITLTEVTIRLELTLPAFWQGLKDAVSNFFGGLFLPKVYAY